MFGMWQKMDKKQSNKESLNSHTLKKFIKNVYDLAFDNLYQNDLLIDSVSHAFHTIEGDKSSNLARSAVLRSMYGLGLLPTKDLQRMFRANPNDDIGFKASTVGNRRNITFGSDRYLLIENTTTIFLKDLFKKEYKLSLPLTLDLNM